jgi:hypothetical protein
MPSTSISLPDFMDEWIKRNHNSLSRYVQDKITEDMKKGQQNYVVEQQEQQKYLNISFMFILTGIGFGLLGFTFLISGTAYIYSSIILLVISIISCIYGISWLNSVRLERKNGKRIEQQELAVNGR